MTDQQPNPRLAPPHYVTYGVISYAPAGGGNKGWTRALTAGPFQTEAQARVEAVSAVLGGGKVIGVIVRLDHGRDRNGERHVVHRINDGKAWWE